MKSISRFFFLIVGISLFATAAYADSQPPAWMKQAAASSVPSYPKDVPAVALHQEQQVTLGSDGKLVTVENYAVKLLSRDGWYAAVARAFYLVSAGKIRSIEAWLIRSDGTVKNYEKNEILDIISDPDDVYNEGRLKVIDASREVDTGHIFWVYRRLGRSSTLLSGQLHIPRPPAKYRFAIHPKSPVRMEGKQHGIQHAGRKANGERQLLHLGDAQPSAGPARAAQPVGEESRSADRHQLFPRRCVPITHADLQRRGRCPAHRQSPGVPRHIDAILVRSG